MTAFRVIALAPLLLFFSTGNGIAADPDSVGAELDGIVTKIQTKLRAGKKTEAEFAPELKEFDLLLARHRGEHSEELANVLVEEASLYLRVFENFDKAAALVERLRRDFPQSKPARSADKLLDSISRNREAKRLKAIFVVGTFLPDFDEKDLNYHPLSIGQFRGKVVLLDFGATWSKAWVNETLNLHRLYEKYHGKGFEIIGVSLDQDQLRLSGFTAENNLTWPQFSDASGWHNKLAIKYGINSLPDNFLWMAKGRSWGGTCAVKSWRTPCCLPCGMGHHQQGRTRKRWSARSEICS